MSSSSSHVFHSVQLLIAFALLACGNVWALDTAAVPFHALLVGGGPDVSSNAAQIEAHVRFVASLLPPTVTPLVLFTDGKADQPSVSYADTSAEADAERALSILLADHDALEPVLRRAPNLGVPPRGPARLKDFHRALAQLSGQAAKQPAAPLLLYFAGHGTQDEKSEQSTRYDLWDGDELKVRDLADALTQVPRQVPVVLIMAQCFSGAFADVIFAHGDSGGAPVPQNIVGFFSARKDHEAAGCSYATEREDYQDFSSYFFGALSGRDRFGDTVTGADYDRDGAVSLHEAFCYALIHDPSADTPVCTTDVFLIHQALCLNEVIYPTPYREVWQAGTPAQRGVLDALSERLGLSGETRALSVFDRLTYRDPAASPALLKTQSDAKAGLNDVRAQALGPMLEKWPVLRWGRFDTGVSDRAFNGAAADLAKDEILRRALLAAEKAHEQAEEAVDIEAALLLRFASVYEHVVEARHLEEHGKTETKARFERLWAAEQQSLPFSRRP